MHIRRREGKVREKMCGVRDRGEGCLCERFSSGSPAAQLRERCAQSLSARLPQEDEL